MPGQRAICWSRREFVGGLTLSGVAGMLGLGPGLAQADPPPETTKLRLLQPTSICWAPQYVAEELLRAEGFAEVQYIKTKGGEEAEKLLASGQSDLSMGFSARHIIRVDAGDPAVMLAGLHVGCFELLTREPVRSIRDLKGKTVAVTGVGTGRHVFFASIAAYVGLDPRTDVSYVTEPAAQAMRRFAEGKIDAFMAFAPEPQELRAKKVGHALVNSATDRPWSQYFCCIVAGNREFVRKHPVATKRALRAILKATSICALEPERAVRLLVEKQVTKSSDFVLQALKEIPYGRWRELEPEDTVRFYALRLHEAGMIKSSPKKILEAGTDWRFLNELKKELTG